MFCSILGFWIIHPLVPGHLSSVKCEPSLVELALSWTSHLLATPTSVPEQVQNVPDVYLDISCRKDKL